MAAQLTLADVVRLRVEAMLPSWSTGSRGRLVLGLSLEEAVAAFPWQPREPLGPEHGTQHEWSKGCRCCVCVDHAARLGLIGGES